MPKDISAIEQIKLLSESVFDFCMNNLGLNIIRVMYNNQISVSGNMEDRKFLNDHDRILYKLLFEIVENAIKQNEIKPGIAAPAVVGALASCYHGSLYDWCLNNGDFDLIEKGKSTIGFLINGFSQ
jgi:hypothetical protein